MKKRLFLVALSVGAWLLSGCASVPMASAQADLTAKEFKAPTNGKAGVYIYRNESFGGGIKMDVFVDEWLIGSTAQQTYHYVEVTPGLHTFRGKAENNSLLSLDAAANKLYYIWQEVKMGFVVARNKLQLVDEQKGQAGVGESQLALSQPIPENNK
ncbi:MAG: DUF2846 domain-containing protein [Helicobacteraceae bacterium]|jgi:hypothetical protein|nr:DUF2846 domain-containing protein [Helicobacteraceae bacterium]